MKKYNLNEKEIVEYLLAGDSLSKIARKYDCDKSVIKRICCENKIPIPKTCSEKYFINNKEVNFILNLYAQNKTLKHIASEINKNKQFKISRDRIRNIIVENNVKLRKRTNTKIDETFFEKIDNYNKAYCLGFLFADGCVFRTKDTQKLTGFFVNIKQSDKEIVSYIHECLNTDYKIRYIKKNNCENQVGLSITNPKLAEQLVNLGCTPRKTHTAVFPDIDDQYLVSFIRGYYDGDGGISNSHNYYVYPVVSICGSENFINRLDFLMQEKIGLKASRIYLSRNIFKLQYNKKHAMKFLNYIYSDNNFCLKRKHDRFLFFKQYYENAGYGKIWRPIRKQAWEEFKVKEEKWKPH